MREGLIAESDEVIPGLLVDYTADSKIVAMDIFGASNRTPAHLWEDAEIHVGKPPLQLQQEYDAPQQRFTITLLNNPSKKTRVATDDERISVWEDTDGQWTSITISPATQSIPSTPSESGSNKSMTVP